MVHCPVFLFLNFFPKFLCSIYCCPQWHTPSFALVHCLICNYSIYLSLVPTLRKLPGT
jgi:hypothetical protein